jgi:hypothetical protein
MLLAKTYGHDIQLEAYKNSVDELINHLNSKHKTIKDKICTIYRICNV